MAPEYEPAYRYIPPESVDGIDIYVWGQDKFPRGNLRRFLTRHVIQERAFSADTNEVLRQVQRLMFPEVITSLYFSARDAYLYAMRLLEQEDALYHAAADFVPINDIRLVPAYERIAAEFRFKPETIQIPLSFDGEPYWRYLEWKWRDWFHSDARNLVRVPGIALAIVRAGTPVERSGPEPAIAARELPKLIDAHYGPLSHAGRNTETA